jgi:hypothetical protein
VRLDSDLIAGNRLVAKRGSNAYGVLAGAKQSGRLAGRSELTLTLTDIMINNQMVPVVTSGVKPVSGLFYHHELSLREEGECRLLVPRLDIVGQFALEEQRGSVPPQPGQQIHRGDRLRQWLAMEPTAFYDESRKTLVPLAFGSPEMDPAPSYAPQQRVVATQSGV